MRLRFVGLNGSMGLRFGQIYRLEIEPWKNGVRIKSPRIVPYDSEEAFWLNWAHPTEEIRPVMEARGRELRKIHIQREQRDTSHVTKNNPRGAVQKCRRRDIHEAHEWQTEFGSYFDVYCPGNDGTEP